MRVKFARLVTDAVVFHFGEVTARERRYYPGEAGVLPHAMAMLPRLPALSNTTHEAVSDASKSTPPTLPPIDTLTNPSASLVPPASRQRRPLQAGDLVYWSHLRSGGERSEPIDPNTRPFLAPQLPGR